jgi:transcriptional regulator with XRE-family HTH domain
VTAAAEVFRMTDPAYAAVYAEEAAMVDASEVMSEALESSGGSAADLARLLDISRSEISARLSGERNITVRKLAATLHALGWELVISARPKTANVRTYEVIESASQPVRSASPTNWKSLPTPSMIQAV